MIKTVGSLFEDDKVTETGVGLSESVSYEGFSNSSLADGTASSEFRSMALVTSFQFSTESVSPSPMMCEVASIH